MVEGPLDHEDLRSIGAVANPDQRCRLPDLVAHGGRCYPGRNRARNYAHAHGRARVGRPRDRDDGPITFAEYMSLALSGPGGFFERPPIGPDGHFVTSPHVHPVFAELLARAIVDLHDRLGAPKPLRLSEAGAGDGTLARQLVELLGNVEVAYTAIDPSPGARAALETIEGIEVAGSLEGSPQLILANELLDNLPFRRLRGTPSGTKEILVALEGDRFVEHLGDPPPGDALPLADGAEAVLPDGATAFIDEVGARLAHPGYALLIDYGGVGEPGGPPHGYRDHRPVDDLLDRPGETDITSGSRLRPPQPARGRAGPDRVPQRDAAPRPDRARLRPLGPRAAPMAGRPPEPSRGAGRRPDVEWPKPRQPARRPLGPRPPPLVAPRDTGTPRTRVDVRPEPV